MSGPGALPGGAARGALAEAAARAFGGRLGPLVAARENAIWRLDLPGGRRAALRLHRPGYSSPAEIESELWWTARLAEAGFPCPAPLAAPDGRLRVELPGPVEATAVTWLEGAPLGAGAAPVPAAEMRFHALGVLLADLHTRSDALALPAGFTRRRWDAEGLLGPAAHWGRFWTHPALDAAGRRLLLAARTLARERLAAAEGLDFGLIHADALAENVLLRPDGSLALIDFDDAGFGWRMYDLAVAGSQALGTAAWPARRDALLAGYATRRPLPAGAGGWFTLFAFCRAAASLGWTLPRLAPEDPAVATYRARALAAARLLLAGA
ncbi:MAG: homoserine kinase [Alphaproteobacteria bacterium]|nr:MAG: homoserine kinase [Alphaproteobacteria bacterium]